MSHKPDSPQSKGSRRSAAGPGSPSSGGGGQGSPPSNPVAPQEGGPPLKAKGEEEEDGGEETEVGEEKEAKRPNRACCFCWCCCCSCSCLTVKNNEENGRNKEKHSSDILNGDEPAPSLDEVRAWGESFDRLMKSSGGRKVFREFLKCEYSEENILFWLACEDLKKESNPETVEEKARLIYDDYISILSPKEVSLDSRVRELVNKNMVHPTTTTFDEAQLQIYTLMHRDSYPRFVNSNDYRKLAQVNATSRKESMA